VSTELHSRWQWTLGLPLLQRKRPSPFGLQKELGGEIGVDSIFRILQGTIGIVFGVALIKSTLLRRWIGAVGVFAGVATIILGVDVAHVWLCDFTLCCGDCVYRDLIGLAGNPWYFYVEKSNIKEINQRS
jgi:hypothetical protein